MAYATYADVIGRYNPLTTMIGTTAPDVTTTDIASMYISDAEGVINAFLGAKYVIPLAMPEPLITRIAADLAIHKVLEDRAARIPEFAVNRNKEAMDLLAMLRDGKMTLTQSQVPTTGGDQEAFSTTGSFHPVFSPVLSDIDQKADIDQIRNDRDERIGDY